MTFNKVEQSETESKIKKAIQEDAVLNDLMAQWKEIAGKYNERIFSIYERYGMPLPDSKIGE